MSRHVVGYEGVGKSRRPIYADEGPASSAVHDPVAAIGVLSATQVKGSLAPTAGAGQVEISRVEVDEATRAQARAARTTVRPRGGSGGTQIVRPGDQIQASRMNGAARHVEVIAARKPAVDHPWGPARNYHAKPQPATEEESVSEPRADHAENIPDPIAASIAMLSEAVTTAAEAWDAKVAADREADHARAWWAQARVALDEAYRAIAIPTVVELAALPASDPPTPKAPEAVVEPTERKPKPVTAGTKPLTTHEQRVLDATVANKGDRKAVAKALGLNFDQSVDQALQKVGQKGRLPIELIPLLPARFAKYSGV